MENKNRYENTPPDPLTMGPPRFPGPICLFPHPLYVQKRHQRKSLDCLHGFDSNALFPLNLCFLINYYKSISGRIRKRVFLERNRFRTISVEFCLSLAVGFR